MTLKDIYDYIERKFPYFKHAKPGAFFYLRGLPLILFNFHFRYLFRFNFREFLWWPEMNIQSKYLLFREVYIANILGWKNSVRHNLSLHPIFVREQPSANSKVSYWCMRPQNNELPLIDDYDEYGRKPEKKRKRERKGTDLNSQPRSRNPKFSIVNLRSLRNTLRSKISQTLWRSWKRKLSSSRVSADTKHSSKFILFSSESSSKTLFCWSGARNNSETSRK